MLTDLGRAAFIDRDGVINEDLGHVGRKEDFRLLPSAAAGLHRLAANGYVLVVVTNQAGIAKGLYSEQDYHQVTQLMIDLLRANQVQLQGIYHCPHHPFGNVQQFAIECNCRKPAPGMLLRAASELQLDLSRSILIGDKVSDIAAGRTAGLRHTILVRSGHPLPSNASRYADYCCRDLSEAAEWACRTN